MPLRFARQLYTFLVGSGAEGDSYWLTRALLLRGLGAIALVTFSILFFQGQALWGDAGLQPISETMAQAQGSFWEWPTLFWFLKADSWIRPLGAVGILGSVALLLGYANFPLLLVLWLIQLSFVNSGQVFYGYGWEIQLLEFFFLSFFLVPLWNPRLSQSRTPPPRVVIWAMRWMLFRLMLGAGLIKIRGDSCWTDLTCLIYHYETQPNPHPLSYFFHLMPEWFHWGGTLFNHFVELVVPFALLGPARLRRAAGLLTLLFQVTLIISGNLAWLNWLTLLMCVPCFDDAYLSRLNKWLKARSWKISMPAMPALGMRLAVLVPFVLLVSFLSIAPAANLLSSRQAMNTSYDSWHLINSYGAFGSIGRERTVVVIRGTTDETITDRTVWKDYEFRCATGDVSRRPCLITPYHYHLDWQMWFSAMRPGLQEEWLFRLAVRLLENDPLIGAQFASKPFGETPPRRVKMDLYRYRFAKWTDWPGKWWDRELIQEYMPPVSLETPLAAKYRKRVSAL